MTPAFADDLRQLLLRVLEALNEFIVACGFLDRIEIRALHVLYDRQFHHLLIAKISHDDGNLVQSCAS